ncbi:hypothetical protein VIGAN_07159700 [Vigna angularis var. angularis]|uniref:Uncharacterized protein n=1 Tax=Vigna angularis var. angularis TaxID=157739 RepID=A0A0S3SJ04_PHAAN|nr:hypothetical protein VIGAN_07159700 [Vigna angularis var. angularis]
MKSPITHNESPFHTPRKREFCSSFIIKTTFSSQRNLKTKSLPKTRTERVKSAPLQVPPGGWMSLTHYPTLPYWNSLSTVFKSQ